MGVLRESDGSWYMREGKWRPYSWPLRSGRTCCYFDGPTDDQNMSYSRRFGTLDAHIESAIARVPAFAEVGVKKVYNGAIAYTPDGPDYRSCMGSA